MVVLGNGYRLNQLCILIFTKCFCRKLETNHQLIDCELYDDSGTREVSGQGGLLPTQYSEKDYYKDTKMKPRKLESRKKLRVLPTQYF